MADETASMVDLLASEYHWTQEQIMETPVDQIAQLTHAIMHRKGVRAFFRHADKDESTPSLAERVRGIFAQVDTES